MGQKRLFFLGFSLWKRGYIRPFFSGGEVSGGQKNGDGELIFLNSLKKLPKFSPNSNDEIYIWGKRVEKSQVLEILGFSNFGAGDLDENSGGNLGENLVSNFDENSGGNLGKNLGGDLGENFAKNFGASEKFGKNAKITQDAQTATNTQTAKNTQIAQNSQTAQTATNTQKSHDTQNFAKKIDDNPQNNEHFKKTQILESVGFSNFGVGELDETSRGDFGENLGENFAKNLGASENFGKNLNENFNDTEFSQNFSKKLAPQINFNAQNPKNFTAKNSQNPKNTATQINKNPKNFAQNLPPNKTPPKIFFVEDGFIRSIALGSDLTRPFSLIIESQNLYLDPKNPSDLENILNFYEFDETLILRAKNLINRLKTLKFSKYNGLRHENIATRAKKDQKIILIAAQVEDDISMLLGGFGLKTLDLIKIVRSENPGAYIIFKPHPDVLSGNRTGLRDKKIISQFCDQILENISIDSAINACDELHTITSTAGFDAILRGKKVVTYGAPFYAGWGLSVDKISISRRRRTLTAQKLAAAALILYPKYINPKTQTLCEIEESLDIMAALQNEYFSKKSVRFGVNLRNFALRAVRRIFEKIALFVKKLK